MTRPRLILLIRTVTLLAVGALLLGAGWLYAGLASVLVGLFMPVFATGSTTCPSVCSNMSASVSWTLSGVTDNSVPSCDCSPYNTTVVSTVVSSCRYDGNSAVNASCGFFIAYHSTFTISGGNSKVTSEADGSLAGLANTGSINIGAGPLDCSELSISAAAATFTDGFCFFHGASIAMVS